MNNNFAKAMGFTLPWEVGKDRSGKLRADGGYTNIPADPGGETKWGISKKAHPTLDIKNLTLEAAFEIYKQDYYEIYRTKQPVVLSLDDCPMPYSVAVFDTGVNCGVNRTYKWHQVAIETKDPVKTLLGLRENHYFNLVSSDRKFNTFFKGWMARVNDLKKYCEVLAQE